ncbi:MAG: hypothetical protein HY736_00090, partial [Verrucomicrobia bacterium]|nr:hypothetical protein [Verrucomicrobiota bacterium]
ALEDAVRDRSLGLLLVGETAAPGPGPFFAPWTFAGDERSAAGDDEPRLVRLRLAGGMDLAEPVATLSAEIVPAPLMRWLARDPQGRVLCAAMRRGHGWVARSLLIDTWRWPQGGHPEIFGAYWSETLSAIARPPAAGPGRWSLEKGGAPLFVGEAIQLAWVGAPEAVPATALAGLRGASAAIPLNCARDPAEPARAEAIYWPAQPGWHEVRSADGKASLAFYVQAAGALPAWRAERRRIATARLVATGTNAAPAAAPVATSPDSARTAAWMAWVAWSVFLLGAGILWSEQRDSSRQDLAGLESSARLR